MEEKTKTLFVKDQDLTVDNEGTHVDVSITDGDGNCLLISLGVDDTTQLRDFLNQFLDK